MKQTTFQHPELRDANDNIIQQGAFGKNTALANSTNDGWIDYVANDLMYLYDNTMGGTGGEINTEKITGKTGTITNLTATTVKAGTLTADALNGPLTGNVTGTADKAVADGDGNNIVNTYVTKSAIASSVTTATGKVTTLTATDSTLTNVTINGETSVPTANEGNSSKAIANTEFVAKSLASLVNGAPAQLNTLNELAKALGNDANFSATITAELAKKLNSTEAESTYLPLSGGTLTGVVNGVTPTAGDNSTKIATTAFVRTIVPAGVVLAYARGAVPTGWLLCDGSAVSRTDYAALYAVIGTTYGAGNGSTTFNLPNLVDKFVEGSATAGTVKSAGLPNITGGGQVTAWKDISYSGAFVSTKGGSTANTGYTADNNYFNIDFDASRSSAIYGNSNTVQPPALTMRYIIKY